MRHLNTLTLALVSAGLLVACGGSGGGDGGSTGATDAPSSGGTSALTLSGVVAKGAALAGATVSAKCATGSTTSVVAGSDGSYTLTISGGALPCVLEATGAGADASLVLHSVATGSTGATSSATSAATANITPLTELLVAQLAGQDPASFMSTVQAAELATALTPAAVTTAQAAVVSTLTAAGVDTSALSNVLTQPLVAATSGSTGNAYDAVLDTLATTLSQAGSSLTELSSTVAQTAATAASPSAASVSASDEGSALPAALLLRPRASSCAALRSTSYQLIRVAGSVSNGASDAITTAELMTVDAQALSASFPDGSVMTMTAVDGAPCRFNFGNGELAVSPAGVIVVRALIGADDDTVAVADRNQYHLMVALPRQSLTVADLAGTWNMMGQNLAETSGFAPYMATAVFNTSGAMTQAQCFDDPITVPLASCATLTSLLPVFSSHSDGGFNVTSTDPGDAWQDRAFAYRAGNGEMLLVTINARGEVGLATKARRLSLPTVGEATTVWNFTADANLRATDALSANVHTIASTGGSSFVRQTSVWGSTITHPQTLTINSPRDGYVQRSAATVSASNGSTVNVREMVSLRLTGMGLTAFYLPNTSAGVNSNARFGLSVKQ